LGRASRHDLEEAALGLLDEYPGDAELAQAASPGNDDSNFTVVEAFNAVGAVHGLPQLSDPLRRAEFQRQIAEAIQDGSIEPAEGAEYMSKLATVMGSDGQPVDERAANIASYGFLWSEFRDQAASMSTEVKVLAADFLRRVDDVPR
jgi:hypothetical protein